MRVQTEEWRRFIPGVRMYKGKKTLFYNGEILRGEVNREYLIYDWEEQQSWEVLIVLPGVEVIPSSTFHGCYNVKTVIMSDSVRRIEDEAFAHCHSLKFVKLSRNLEYIGSFAFLSCTYLTSIFIPPACREIGNEALARCKKLIILNVSRQTQLGENVIANTALIRESPFEIDTFGEYDVSISENVNEWIKSINRDDNQFALHRACSSFNPIADVLHQIVRRQGLESFRKKNEIDITPSEYLEANPFAEDIDQNSIVKRYILEMMGEAV